MSDSIKDTLNTTMKSTYLCEVCGKEEHLTEMDAYNAGWDYPPFIGEWGVVSPRTCGECYMDKTAWWYVNMIDSENIPENHFNTIQRIIAEVGHE